MEKEFDEALEKISRLYEGGKDCVHFVIGDYLPHSPEWNKLNILLEIIREFRDVSALAYKKLNSINQN